VPVRAASSCQRFQDVFRLEATAEAEVAAVEAAVVLADEAAAEPMRAGREVETEEKMFQIEVMFWYWVKAP
jgi:hypothetical protein